MTDQASDPAAADVRLDTIERAVADVAAGRAVVVVDDADRENEGDLIFAAQRATPALVGFMIRHTSGFICVPMEGAELDRLGLPMMTYENEDTYRTAYTVSVDARHGVTTGISAHDRAHTISVAIDPTKGPDDIVMPGHVFPLVARHGGVLVRTGHTEAAVDIARLAGLYPAGVICEIMNDDGTMARLPDLVKFAQLHGLKVGTIADLIAYRRKHDHFVRRTKEIDFESRNGGLFKLYVYLNTIENQEHVALVKGDISGAEPPLVRMHAYNLFDDTLAAKWGQGDVLG
ncbi:MAG: 3,4-dihydroxy-2-butanone-4-phosphate synthase, partial [Actinomycetes bacterium]